MADPALLELLRHLSWQPPAIVQAAPSASGPNVARVYERYIEENEGQVEIWKAQGLILRETLWARLQAESPDLDVETMTDIIEQYEWNMRREAREVRRIEKRARHEENVIEPAERAQAARLHDRLIALAHRFFEDGLDFALFLRAVRAEIDPETRGGPVFDDPDALERYLLTETA